MTGGEGGEGEGAEPELTIVAIDDEPLALARLESLMPDIPGARLVAMSDDPEEALALVDRHHPDVVLLDIDMPGINGLDLATAIGRADAGKPLILFLTAHRQHAVEAFETQAADYILKPTTAARLRHGLDRARALVAQQKSAERLRELEQQMLDGERDDETIWALRGSEYVQLRVADIERVESERDYVHLHNGERSFLLRMTLGAAHERLGADRYIRVRRSAIVRVDHIAAVRDNGYGEMQVHLRSGAVTRVGRTYLKPLRERLKGWDTSQNS